MAVLPLSAWLFSEGEGGKVISTETAQDEEMIQKVLYDFADS
jgi:hypothetical protein